MGDRRIAALHVIPSLSLKHGGPSYAVRALARALAGVEVDVTIATTDDDGNDSRLKVLLGEPVKEDAATIYYFRRDILPYKVSFGLSRWLSANVARFDVVHIHALFSFSSTIAARAAQRHSVPYIVRPLGVLNRWGLENRHAFLKQISLRLVELPILRDAAVIHYTSDAEKLEASRISDNIASQKSTVIPLPIEIAKGNPEDFRKRFPQVAGHKVILFLSRIDEKKGIELLLDAFAEVRRQISDTVLVVAGDGAANYVQKLSQRAKELAIAETVIWTGHLDGAIKWGAFAAADLFVLPSYSENFGIAAAEALACGVPTVVTKGVGIADEIRSGDGGLVVEATSTAIANALEQLLGNESRRHQLAENGRELAQQHFSSQSVGHALESLYRKAIASSPLNR
jgi:glycosyltransferase involved in cell wall biosynthesis